MPPANFTISDEVTVMVLPTRKVVRLKNFDYSSVNYYFITICAYEKRCLFGDVHRLSEIGKIVKQEMERLSSHYVGVYIDHFIVMTNHLHMILVLEGEDIKHPSVQNIISFFKAGVSRRVREIFPERKIWQRSFYEHVIRNQGEYEKIWEYIEYNPMKWKKDRFYLQVQNENLSGGINAAPTKVESTVIEES